MLIYGIICAILEYRNNMCHLILQIIENSVPISNHRTKLENYDLLTKMLKKKKTVPNICF